MVCSSNVAMWNYRLLSIHHPELQHCFKYCISGGDESLVISNELPEDDPRQVLAHLLSLNCSFVSSFIFLSSYNPSNWGYLCDLKGEEDLKARCRGCDRVMYFGITCGLSAPYVAGQINYAMHEVGHKTKMTFSRV